MINCVEMKRIIKVLLLVVFAMFVMVASCGKIFEAYNANHPSGSNKYYELLTGLSPKESIYMKLGKYEVKTYEETATGTLGTFRMWYPAEATISSKKFPVIVSNNGTGWPATKYPEWFKHMASWGFIVVGNDEGTSWKGDSAQATLEWLINLNNTKSSVIYKKADLNNIGTVGHSQGGTGVENAITVQPSASMYKAAVMLASTYNGYNVLLKWDADASKIKIPIMILVADSDGLTPLKDYNTLWNALPSKITKVAGRRKDCAHGDMLVYGDGYVTAWFLYYLQGNTEALEAIKELKSNKSYVEVRTKNL